MMRAEDVRFDGADRAIDGYLALPEGREGPLPAVIVIHEIWGLDEHIRDVARRFAREGYVALAPDLYTGPWRDAMQPERIMAGMQFLRAAPPELQRDPSRMGAALAERSPEEQTALKTLMQVMRPEQRAAFADDLLGAVSYLRGRAEVDPRRISSLGFCMGGGISGQLATKAKDLYRCVIFYGENPPLGTVGEIHAQVLGLYGGDDARITETVPEFVRAMQEAGKELHYHIYPGAPHAFFNDTRPTYRPEAAASAWQEVLRILP